MTSAPNPPPRDLFNVILMVALIVLGLACMLGNSAALFGQLAIGGLDATVRQRVAPFFTIAPWANWLFVILLMLLFLALLGRAKHNRVFGILIDSNYTMSLSRLQITLWTVLALSAYLIIFLTRLGGLSDFESLKAKNPPDALIAECAQRLDKPIAQLTAEACGSGALQIIFPPELILAMGISLTSFAGSSLIDSKKQKEHRFILTTTNAVESAKTALKNAEAHKADLQRKSEDKKAILDGYKDEREKIRKQLAAATAAPDLAKLQADIDEKDDLIAGAQEEYDNVIKVLTDAEEKRKGAEQQLQQALDQQQKAQAQSAGLLYKNTEAKQASLMDLFAGVEIGNHGIIDMSRVQMFFFTIIVVLAYAVQINALLQEPAALRHPLGISFPTFSESLNVLLGVSHGTYLSVKTVDHTTTQ